MGFESSRAARRRLATIAATNPRVSADIAQSIAPAPHAYGAPSLAPEGDGTSALAEELDMLAHDIVATPGAGGALLAAFASQTRALHMVVEAAKRAGTAPLPVAVVLAAQAALSRPESLASLSFR